MLYLFKRITAKSLELLLAVPQGRIWLFSAGETSVYITLSYMLTKGQKYAPSVFLYHQGDESKVNFKHICGLTFTFPLYYCSKAKVFVKGISLSFILGGLLNYPDALRHV